MRYERRDAKADVSTEGVWIPSSRPLVPLLHAPQSPMPASSSTLHRQVFSQSVMPQPKQWRQRQDTSHYRRCSRAHNRLIPTVENTVRPRTASCMAGTEVYIHRMSLVQQQFSQACTVRFSKLAFMEGVIYDYLVRAYSSCRNTRNGFLILPEAHGRLLTPGNSIHCPTHGAPPLFARSNAARRRVLPISDTIAVLNSSDMIIRSFLIGEWLLAHSSNVKVSFIT